jgi:5-methylthioadenosine/S-adenosylhomocysteine deaminase
MCLGTDGQGSGNNMNLFYHMSIVDLLQKGNYKDSTIMSSYDTLKMATINGAKALGLEDKIGSIEVGKKADIILIDTNSANMVPDSSTLTSNIIYSANGSNVDTTICNGKILMENKKLTVLDEDEIYAKARQAIIELKEAI